ncbi:hypothetical protein TUMEXPCC7403_02930 [Tumidithrix helvetica PCC 7403]|uniref:hypothetical protein n=1 Tax=Tumidithrix helvetica TaxID=3457545 RepID=UPI003C8C9632
MNKVLGKIAGVAFPYGLFWLGVYFSGQTFGAGSSFTVALNSLGFGQGIPAGILTLLVAALAIDAFTSRILKGL